VRTGGTAAAIVVAGASVRSRPVLVLILAVMILAVLVMMSVMAAGPGHVPALMDVQAIARVIVVLPVVAAVAAQRSLGLELIHRHGGLDAGVVHDGRLVDRLVDGDDVVHDVRLDGLLLHDGLHVLVDVVVVVLAGRGLGVTFPVDGLLDVVLVAELLLLLVQLVVDAGVVAVLVVLVLHGHHVVVVLRVADLAVLDGLDGGLVVLVVDFTVYCRGVVLGYVILLALVGDGRVDLLLYRGVMLAVLAKHGGNGFFRFLHVEGR